MISLDRKSPRNFGIGGATSRILVVLGVVASCAAVACSADEGGFADADGGAAPGIVVDPAANLPAATRDGTSCNPYDPITSCTGTSVTGAAAQPDGGASDSGPLARIETVDASGESRPADPARDSGADSAPRSTLVSCAPSNQCASAAELLAISGDYGADQVIARGVGSRWFSVRVREDSVGGGETKFQATLISPAGTDYDLAVYMDVDNDVLECSKKAASSSKPGNAIENVSKAWGWAFYDDSRTVRFEVKHVSGPCDSELPWTLVINGNR